MKYISRFLTQWASLVVGLWLAGSCFAEQVHIAHCKDGCPLSLANDLASAATQSEIIVRHLYAASISSTGLAEWVAYRVLPETVGVASLLPRYWRLDELSRAANTLESEVGESTLIVQTDLSNSQDRDYRINEITILEKDRGRLVPMTSFAGTPYWDELNYLSNMTLLPTALRTGAWSRLDQVVNELAQAGSSYYVLSGPVYSDEMKDDGGLKKAETTAELVPELFFKVIAGPDGIAAFAFPENVEPQSPFCEYSLPLDQISTISGLDFFPNSSKSLPEDLLFDLGCQR
jgi:endonuclease G